MRAFPALKANPGNLVEKGPVAQLLETVLFRSGQAVYLVPSIGLGNEDRSLGIDRHAVKQSAKGIDGLDELVGLCIEYEQIPIGNAGMLDDIGDMSKGEHVVVGYGMLVCIEGHEVSVDFVAS